MRRCERRSLPTWDQQFLKPRPISAAQDRIGGSAYTRVPISRCTSANSFAPAASASSDAKVSGRSMTTRSAMRALNVSAAFVSLLLLNTVPTITTLGLAAESQHVRRVMQAQHVRADTVRRRNDGAMLERVDRGRFGVDQCEQWCQARYPEHFANAGLHRVENQVAAECLRARQPADQQSEAAAVDPLEGTAVEDHFRLTW